MVGLAVAVMRGTAPEDAIQLALDARRSVETPTAPAVGLFLDESIFESYNTRWGSERGDLLSLDDFKPQVADFKARSLFTEPATTCRLISCRSSPGPRSQQVPPGLGFRRCLKQADMLEAPQSLAVWVSGRTTAAQRICVTAREQP